MLFNLWGKKEELEKKKVPCDGDEMRRRDSIGYEGKAVQKVGGFDEKAYEKLDALCRELG